MIIKLTIKTAFLCLIIIIVGFFRVSQLKAQPFNVPSSELIKKNQIRKLKIYHTYDLDSNHNPVNNGRLDEVYYFNKKGLLVKEKDCL